MIEFQPPIQGPLCVRVLRGVRCGSSAGRDLRGGCRTSGVPTSIDKNMRLLFIAILSVCIPALSYADTLSDSDLRGVWHAQFAGPHKDSMLGAIEWISITFQKENRVAWKWKRDGRIEEHKGTYSLSEILVKGARSQWDIALKPDCDGSWTTQSMDRSPL
jgi:hypothetical protein